MTDREQFEAWMKSRSGYPFAAQFANLMWAAWQASCATPADPMPDAAEKVDAVSVPVAWIDPDGDSDSNVMTAQWKQKLLTSITRDGYERSFAERHSVPLHAVPPSPQVSDNVRDAVIEECAKECDDWASAYRIMAQGDHSGASDHREGAALEIAENIRALKSAPPQKPVSE